MYDFHTHTFLSDGVLAPVELIRRAVVIGYRVIAITDHVGPGNMEPVVRALIKDCDSANRRWDILALPGVEITHCPVDDIDALAREARAIGAKVVNVHGETVVESVEPGTNGLGRLVLRQQPFLYEANIDDSENPLVLANDVVAFNVKFLPDGAEEWEEEWLYTNELPVMAHVTLSFRHGESVYENHKLIALASSAVPAEFQLGIAGGSGGRGPGGSRRGDPRGGGVRGDGPRYPSGNMFNRPGGNSRSSSGNRRGPNGNFGDSRDRGGSRGGGSRGGGGGSGGGGRP